MAWRAGGACSVSPTLDLKAPSRVPQNDLECLAQAVYYEARNETEEGQTTIAEVVINRSRHRAYPKSICEVAYQRNSRTYQFTLTGDGSIGRRPSTLSSRRAPNALPMSSMKASRQANCPGTRSTITPTTCAPRGEAAWPERCWPIATSPGRACGTLTARFGVC